MPPIIRKQQADHTRVTREVRSVLDRIRPVGFEEHGLRCLVYGQSGTGKTTLWSTFPGPILCVLCSGSLEPGELRSIDTPELRAKVDQVSLYSVAEASEVVEHARTSGKYQTVVLDHASGLQDLTLKEVLGLEQLPAQKSWGMATQQDYGQSTLQSKEVLRALLSLRCNVVIVAQERTFGEGGDSEVVAPTVGPSLTPSLAGWLCPACDYVVQTYKRPVYEVRKTTIGSGKNAQTVETRERGRGVEYCLRTGPHDVYMTKFRIPRGRELPECIVDPTYEKLDALVRGEEPLAAPAVARRTTGPAR